MLQSLPGDLDEERVHLYAQDVREAELPCYEQF
jgi:hypothetical protein